MKNKIGAPSILAIWSFFILAGCESIYIPNFFGRDEVPDEVKAKPRAVSASRPSAQDDRWPRLGDVPFKPKDMPPPEAFFEDIEALRASRSEAFDYRERAEAEQKRAHDAAVQGESEEDFIRPPRMLKTIRD